MLNWSLMAGTIPPMKSGSVRSALYPKPRCIMPSAKIEVCIDETLRFTAEAISYISFRVRLTMACKYTSQAWRKERLSPTMNVRNMNFVEQTHTTRINSRPPNSMSLQNENPDLFYVYPTASHPSFDLLWVPIVLENPR